MPQKILITGGAGFIGSWLAEKLLAGGKKVFVIDNLSTGRFDNIKHLTGDANFHCEVADIFDEPKLKVLIDQVDYVCHLGAAVGVKRVMEQPLKSLETNIRGTQLVLELASEKKKPVLLTSTSEVYGENGHLPFTEESDRVFGSVYNHRWGYALSKAIDEFLVLAYWRERGLPTVVVRLFNTVGPRQVSDYGMVLPTFVKQCLRKEPLTIHGSGNQRRCFCYVTDVVEGLVKIIQSDRVFGEVFNLGSTEEITIKALALKVKELTNSQSEITYTPYHQAYGDGFEDMERRVPDISKAQRLLGYQPQHSLDEIIKRVSSYQREEIAGLV